MFRGENRLQMNVWILAEEGYIILQVFIDACSVGDQADRPAAEEVQLFFQ